MARSFGVLIACLACCGCIQNEYDIELTPNGDKLERRFHARRVASKSQEELDADVARLAKEYGRKPPVANNEQRFRGTFSGRLPNDVGGHGAFTRYDSPLGSVSMYVERFRGDDDLAGLLERRKSAIDHVVSLLIGWLETELKTDARWPAFQKFLHEDFRRDMYNLSLHLLLTPPVNPEKQEDLTQLTAVFQYLVEHRYLTADDLPKWKRAFEDANRQDYSRLLECYRKLILARMDDGTTPPPELKFLKDKPSLEESLCKYLSTTEEYGIARNAWLEQRKTDPDAAEPDALDVIGQAVAENLTGIVNWGGDQLTLKLNLERPAMHTNGTATGDSPELTWIAKPLPNAEMPSRLAYAVWDEPNELAQKLVFGRSILAGKPLLEYCLWYRGLSDAERTAWDDFLASLQPAPELKGKIEAFRFAGELADGESIAKPGVDAILGGLNESSTDAPSPPE